MKKLILSFCLSLSLISCVAQDPKSFEIQSFDQSLLDNQDFKGAVSKLSDEDKALLEMYFMLAQGNRLQDKFTGTINSLSDFPITIGDAIERARLFKEQEDIFQQEKQKASKLSEDDLETKRDQIDRELTETQDSSEVKRLKRLREMYSSQLMLLYYERQAKQAEQDAIQAQKEADIAEKALQDYYK